MNNTFSERRKYFKKEARERLFSSWLSCIFAFLVLIFIVFGMIGIIATVYQLSELLELRSVDTLLTLLLLFTEIFVVVPMIYGFLTWYTSLSLCEEKKLGALLDIYADKSLVFRSYSLFVRVALRELLFFLPYIAAEALKEGFGDALAFNMLSYAAIGFGAVMSATVFFPIYYTIKHSDKSVAYCFSQSSFVMSGHVFETICVFLSFAPVIILSLFTVGFLFIVYTVPYLILTLNSYFAYLECLYEAKPVPFESDARRSALA